MWFEKPPNHPKFLSSCNYLQPIENGVLSSFPLKYSSSISLPLHFYYDCRLSESVYFSLDNYIQFPSLYPCLQPCSHLYTFCILLTRIYLKWKSKQVYYKLKILQNFSQHVSTKFQTSWHGLPEELPLIDHGDQAGRGVFLIGICIPDEAFRPRRTLGACACLRR